MEKLCHSGSILGTLMALSIFYFPTWRYIVPASPEMPLLLMPCPRLLVGMLLMLGLIGGIPYLSLINKKTVSNGYGIHRGNSQRRLLGISSDPKEMWCLGLRLCGAHPCRRDTKPTYGLLPVTGCQLRFFSSHLR